VLRKGQLSENGMIGEPRELSLEVYSVQKRDKKWMKKILKLRKEKVKSSKQK
jgi:hypothetical protein